MFVKVRDLTKDDRSVIHVATPHGTARCPNQVDSPMGRMTCAMPLSDVEGVEGVVCLACDIVFDEVTDRVM